MTLDRSIACTQRIRLFFKQKSLFSEFPDLTGQKVGKVGKAFPTFIEEAPRLQITLKNRALISYLYLDCLELTHE